MQHFFPQIIVKQIAIALFTHELSVTVSSSVQIGFKWFVFATLYSANTVNEGKMWLTRDTNTKIAFAIVWFLTSVTKEIFTSNNTVMIHVCLPPATIRSSYDRLYFMQRTLILSIICTKIQSLCRADTTWRGWKNCTLCCYTAAHGHDSLKWLRVVRLSKILIFHELESALSAN